MKKTDPKTKSALNDDCPSGSLPEKHYAILIEGAWIFSKTDGGEILATCPFTTSDHQCDFGIWNPNAKKSRKKDNSDDNLTPVPGFGEKVMQLGMHFDIQVSGAVGQAVSFDDVFGAAAEKYPFVFMKSTSKNSKKRISITPKLSATGKSPELRTVRIPLPSCIYVAGKLKTAQVAGNDKGMLFPPGVTATAHVTFIFVYVYDDELNSTVNSQFGTGEIYANEDQPTPHLIFKCFPVQTQQAVSGMATSVMPMAMGCEDDSFEKNHASSVFEMMRQMVLCKSTPPGEDPSLPLDIALYHDPTKVMCFDVGDSGLTPAEIGIPPCITELSLFSNHMAGCAVGGIVSN